MNIEVYPVDGVFGSKVADDGSTVDLICAWGDGERFILRLPLSVANAMQIALQDAASDAAIRGGSKVAPAIAEALLLQASSVPGQDTLTVRMDGGMQLQFLVPQGRYDNGIRRAPDSQRPSGGRDGEA